MPCWSLEALNAAIGAQSWHRALHLMAQGLALRLAPDMVTYTAAITLCPWRLALRLLERLKETQLRPNGQALTAALRACARSRAWPKALVLFKELEATDEQNLLAHCDLVSAHTSSRHLEPCSALKRVYACRTGMDQG